MMKNVTMTKRTLLSSVLLAILFLASSPPAHAQAAIFMLRHAERAEYDSGDGPLSEAGEKRAKDLANLLKDAGVKAIYISKMRRTLQTAEPLAKALSLTPMVVAGKDSAYAATMIHLLRSHNDEDVVLIIGHFNTFLPLLRAMGHVQEVKIGDFEHDDIFVVVPKETGPTVIRLNY